MYLLKEIEPFLCYNIFSLYIILYEISLYVLCIDLKYLVIFNKNNLM